MAYPRWIFVSLLIAAQATAASAAFTMWTDPALPRSTAPTRAVFFAPSYSPFDGSQPKVWREGSILHVVASGHFCSIFCLPDAQALSADFGYLEPGSYTVVLTIELAGPVPGIYSTEVARYPLQILRGPPFRIEPPQPREDERIHLSIDLIDPSPPPGPPVKIRPGRIEVPLNQGGVIPVPGGPPYELDIDPLPAGRYDLDVLINGELHIRQPLEILPKAATLQDGRFEVTVSFTTADGHSGSGYLQQAPSRDSALYYFFAPGNWELMLKVLDGCAINGHYWVFSAAATDVAFKATVTERATLRQFEVVNPLGHPAAATAATNAFPCR